jgi:UDP-N-acetylglucosamine 1-carboxyvinyltransferase
MTTKARADSVLINGRKTLEGNVSIQGSKNAALPILAATILFQEECYLHNVPDLLDIRAMLEILEFLGAETSFENGTVYVNGKGVKSKPIPAEISNKLRASSLMMGPLLARFGGAEVGMPGGCNIGPRPLDYHFSGFEQLGAMVSMEEERVIISVGNEGVGGSFSLAFPSVGATENLILASVFCKKTVVLQNVAKEPEVLDMINFLTNAGADIQFTDVSVLEIKGVERLRSIEYTIKPDRIEAGTFLIAAFATKGSVKCIGADENDLEFVLYKLEEMGALIKREKDGISLSYNGIITPTNIKTAIYPGFPTDLQPQMSVLLTQASGESIVTERIFDNRLRHFPELQKMNAKVLIEGNQAIIQPSLLKGATVDSYDLRGAAAMISAGLCAKGTTRVKKLHYLYRGYEAYIEKLKLLGADIGYF